MGVYELLKKWMFDEEEVSLKLKGEKAYIKEEDGGLKRVEGEKKEVKRIKHLPKDSEGNIDLVEAKKQGKIKVGSE